MGWARFDDRRVDHPKLLAAGLEARGLDEAAICWVAGHETDGWIPEAAVRMICAGHGCARWTLPVSRLCAVGRWEPMTDQNAIAGYYIHDYLDYNPTKAHRVEVREKKKESGRLGGIAKAKQSANQNATDDGKYGAYTRPVPLVKGGRGLKPPRGTAQPPSFAAADAIPIDPEAGAKLRAVAQQELGEKLGKK